MIESIHMLTVNSCLFKQQLIIRLWFQHHCNHYLYPHQLVCEEDLVLLGLARHGVASLLPFARYAPKVISCLQCCIRSCCLGKTPGFGKLSAH